MKKWKSKCCLLEPSKYLRASTFLSTSLLRNSTIIIIVGRNDVILAAIKKNKKSNNSRHEPDIQKLRLNFKPNNYFKKPFRSCFHALTFDRSLTSQPSFDGLATCDLWEVKIQFNSLSKLINFHTNCCNMNTVCYITKVWIFWEKLHETSVEHAASPSLNPRLAFFDHHCLQKREKESTKVVHI